MLVVVVPWPGIFVAAAAAPPPMFKGPNLLPLPPVVSGLLSLLRLRDFQGMAYEFAPEFAPEFALEGIEEQRDLSHCLLVNHPSTILPLVPWQCLEVAPLGSRLVRQMGPVEVHQLIEAALLPPASVLAFFPAFVPSV